MDPLGSTALNWGSTGRNIYLVSTGVYGGPLVGIQINNLYTVNSRYIEAGYNEIPVYSELCISPRILNAFIFIRL